MATAKLLGVPNSRHKYDSGLVSCCDSEGAVTFHSNNHGDKKDIHEQTEPIDSVSSSNSKQTYGLERWDTNKIFYAWLSVCYSTGPTSAMSKSYVPAVIQSIAHALGHKKGSNEPCDKRGDNCYVQFGTGEVQYSSYVLYLKAIYTSIEGLVAIILMGIADYSNYRKWLMCGSIFLFGCFATPFVGLTAATRPVLIIASTLYSLLLVLDTVYQITEASYIPIFMRARYQKLVKMTADEEETESEDQVPAGGKVLKRGATVSATGLIIGNVGGITALSIGVVITQTKGTALDIGYHDFLLAITVAGCVTTGFSIISAFLIPSLKGKDFDFSENSNKTLAILTFPMKRFCHILTEIYQYKEAFKYVIAWVLWNISYSNFLSIFGLLFRSTLGVGSSDKEYTVWQFISYVVGSLGSLFWMLAYSWICGRQADRKNVRSIKRSLYFLLSFGFFANFWGALGANSDSVVGFKHRWEFWTFQVLFVSSSSAIRSLNRVVYSSLLPNGEESQYFGLEIMLGLATGWSESLVIAVIQDRTGNSRLPFIPNCCLFGVAVLFYWWTDLEKGMKQVNKI